MLTLSSIFSASPQLRETDREKERQREPESENPPPPRGDDHDHAAIPLTPTVSSETLLSPLGSTQVKFKFKNH